MIKLDEQLKEAIVRMPAKEKDKLLLRLIPKDPKLVRRLIFELLEGGSTRDVRAAQLRAEIAQNLEEIGKQHLSPGYLLLYLRHWNARITEHVQATKDKEGEVTLTLFMLAESFRQHHAMLNRHHAKRSETLAPYLVKRTASVLKKAEKLHEDLFVEFRRDAQDLLRYLWAFAPTAKMAQEEGLPRSWEG